MTRLFYWIAYLLFLVTALGCATTKHAVISCEPTTAQETQLLTASSNTDELAALALIDAVDFALCVKQAFADKYITNHQQPPAPADAGGLTADLAQANSVDAIRFRNLVDWRAEHP